MAATVSVAERTLLTMSSSVSVSTWKIVLLMNTRKILRQMKPMTVPTTPRKLIMAKFSKKSDFRRLYPAEKIIGGRMMAKKI